MLAAQAELGQLEKRRETLLRLIESLRAASGDEHLELEPPPGYVPKGLTEEIRAILKLTTVHLDPVQIRDSLIRRGFTSMTPRNLLISVHTVLSRLYDARELDVAEREGKPSYKKRRTIGDMIAEGATSDDATIPRTPAEAKQRFRPQERFSLDQTKGKK